MENRSGLIIDVEAFQVNGTAQRDAALIMLEKLRGRHAVLVGGDKEFTTFGFVEDCQNLRVTPHVAQNLTGRGGSAIGGRTTRQTGYANQPEKDRGMLRLVGAHCAHPQDSPSPSGLAFSFARAAYNLLRIRNLTATVPEM